MADQLATPADLAALLQQDLDLATATLVLEAATAVVQEVAGRQRLVQVVDDVVTVVGTTSGWLQLPQRPVTAVSAVTLDGAALSAGTATGTYRRSGSALWRDTGWATYAGEPSAVVVTYTHGYAPGAQELQLARTAVLSIARAAYANPGGMTREQIDDYSVAYEAATARLDASAYLRAALQRQYGRRAGLA